MNQAEIVRTQQRIGAVADGAFWGRDAMHFQATAPL